MPAVHKGSPSVEDQVRTELELIRAQVTGVRGSLAATSDGLVFADDVLDLEPTQIAAISAATLALASRATLTTGCGNFREVVVHGSDGYLAVYAAGNSAIVAVIGTSSLNVGMLQYRARAIIDRIAAHSTQREAWAAPARPGTRATTAAAGKQARGTSAPTLPRRRPPVSLRTSRARTAGQRAS